MLLNKETNDTCSYLNDFASIHISLLGCHCGNCELAYLQNISECYCCCELDGCVEALVSDIVLQDLPEGTKLITENPGFEAVCLQKSTHLFSSFSFLAVLCSIRRYRMKSNIFFPIWSVVTTENSTGIRHFR